MSKHQRIVCAANRFTFADGAQLVVTGVRHWDPLMHAQVKALDQNTWAGMVKEEQGFVDNKMTFLSREEAWAVASTSDQILVLVGNQHLLHRDDPSNKLYSENLY